MQALLVHSPADVDSLHRQGIGLQNILWLATHPAVAERCRLLGMDSLDMNSLLTEHEQYDVFFSLLPTYVDALLKLDDLNSSRLNISPGQPALHWFYDLYRYIGLHAYIGLVQLKRSLERSIERHGITSLMVYPRFECEYLPLLDSSHYMQAVQMICADYHVKLIVMEEDATPKSLPVRSRFGALIPRIMRSLPNAFPALRRRLACCVYGRKKGSPISLLTEPLYEAASLAENLPNLLIWPECINHGVPYGLSGRRGWRQTADTVIPDLVRLSSFDCSSLPFFDIFQDAMSSHLRAHYADFRRKLSAAARLARRFHIAHVIWGVPPVGPSDARPLLMEWFRLQSMPVCGVQHGGTYGILPIDTRHGLSDYYWCDIFLSYGNFDTKLDYAPNLGLEPARIMAIGSMAEAAERRRRVHAVHVKSEQVDILYPIGVGYDLLSGQPVLPADRLMSCQRTLCRCLEEAPVTSLIKPMRGYECDWRRTFMCEDLRALQHAKVDDTVTFSEALKKYRPRLIVCDYISTPLYQCLCGDWDIIQLQDPTAPLKPWARTLLEQRVYVTDSVDETVLRIADFVAGRLTKRRDNGFYEQQVCAEGDPVARACQCLRASTH